MGVHAVSLSTGGRPTSTSEPATGDPTDTATAAVDEAGPEDVGPEVTQAEAGEDVPAEATAAEPAVTAGRVRTVAAVTTTVLACLLVWFALVSPDQIRQISTQAFLRVPIEAVVLVALIVVLPPRPRKILVITFGVLLGVLTVIKIIDMGFFEVLNRPFDPATDMGYFGSVEGLLDLAIGHTYAVVFMVAAVVLGVAVLVFVPLGVVRLSRYAARHRTTSLRTAGVLGVVWLLCAVFGVQIAAGAPVASSSIAGLAYDQVRQVSDGIQDKSIMNRTAANDPYRNIPAADLLTALRGKDVIIAFVESYGQTAVTGSSFSPEIDNLLTAGSSELSAAGYQSRSAFMTSPTFGGISWLAHSTLQSGVWIDNQQKYNDLVSTDRFTLSDAFADAGWRTVADVPSNEKAWPEGQTFYHYQQIYDQHNVGYTGPNFAYASMPDQYTMAAFQRLELAKPHHTPVMAEIDLVSSHTPWAPLPYMVPWYQVGNGSVFKGMPARGLQSTTVWQDGNSVRQAYGQSIAYTMTTLISYLQTFRDPNLVMLVLGDHQPATIVSGQGASHEVPVSIIAHDPTVIQDIASWGWQPGLLPGPDAPVWRMDTFRDRFLTAFDTQPAAH